jgi:hypothetical protein
LSAATFVSAPPVLDIVSGAPLLHAIPPKTTENSAEVIIADRSFSRFFLRFIINSLLIV